jgi:hypothetical protein
MPEPPRTVRLYEDGKTKETIWQLPDHNKVTFITIPPFLLPDKGDSFRIRKILTDERKTTNRNSTRVGGATPTLLTNEGSSWRGGA